MVKSSMQLTTTREAVEAYEKRSGFQGLGRFMEERGLFLIKERKRCQPE